MSAPSALTVRTHTLELLYHSTYCQYLFLFGVATFGILAMCLSPHRVIHEFQVFSSGSRYDDRLRAPSSHRGLLLTRIKDPLELEVFHSDYVTIVGVLRPTGDGRLCSLLAVWLSPHRVAHEFQVFRCDDRLHCTLITQSFVSRHDERLIRA